MGFAVLTVEADDNVCFEKSLYIYMNMSRSIEFSSHASHVKSRLNLV